MVINESIFKPLNFCNMKKLLTLSFFVALLLFNDSKGFSQAFNKGDKLVNLGIGLLDFGGYASAEFGIQDNIGVGPIIGYTYYAYGLLSGYGSAYNYGQFRAGVRGAYHLGEVFKLSDNKFDPYAALSVGLLFDRDGLVYNSVKNDFEYTTRTRPFFNPRVGARIELSDKLGGYAELGWGGSWIQAGISFKL